MGSARILLIVAVLPAIAMLLFVYYRDKKEKEPVKLIALLMGIGAATIIPAAIIEIIGALMLDASTLNGYAYYFIYCFCIIGVTEELGKFLVCVIPTWKNDEFKHSYDAIVYAVATSLGFAMLENIIYVFENGLAIGILRAFTAIPIHCALGVVMGMFYAKAREAAYKGHSSESVCYMILAYIVPVIAHAAYDYFALTEMVGLLLMILVCAYAVAIILILYCSKHDHRIDGLPETADYGVYGKEYRGFGNRNRNRYQNSVPPYGQNYGYNQNYGCNQNQNYGYNQYNTYNRYSGTNHNYYNQTNNYRQNPYGGYSQNYGYSQNNAYNQSNNYRQNQYSGYQQNQYNGYSQYNGYNQNNSYQNSNYQQNNYTYNPYRKNDGTNNNP